MPDIIPQGNPPIQSYSASELARGFILETYYIGKYVQDNDETSGLIISNTTFYSHDVATNWPLSAGGKVLELDMDMEFTQPRRINGDCIFSIPVSVVNRATNESDNRISGMIIAKRVDMDGNETILKNQATGIWFAPSVDQHQVWSNFIGTKINLSNADFKIGEKLRFTFHEYLNATQINQEGAVGHDPVNRDGSADHFFVLGDDTNFIIQIPFKADI